MDRVVECGVGVDVQRFPSLAWSRESNSESPFETDSESGHVLLLGCILSLSTKQFWQVYS